MRRDAFSSLSGGTEALPPGLHLVELGRETFQRLVGHTLDGTKRALLGDSPLHVHVGQYHKVGIEALDPQEIRRVIGYEEVHFETMKTGDKEVSAIAHLQ